MEPKHRPDGRLMLKFRASVTAMVTFNVGNGLEKQKFRVYRRTFSATITQENTNLLTRCISAGLQKLSALRCGLQQPVKSNIHPQVSWSAISEGSDRTSSQGTPSTGEGDDDSSPDYDEAVASRASPEQLINLAELWILGDRIRSPGFRNHIMGELRAETKIKPVVTTAWMVEKL